MSSLDNIIFKTKKFSDLMSEVYDNQKDKEKLIKSLISELKPLITSIGDATLIVPLIKEYLEIGVKNDEQLLKLATIVQRVFQTTAAGGGENDLLSEKDKEQLLKSISDIRANIDK